MYNKQSSNIYLLNIYLSKIYLLISKASLKPNFKHKSMSFLVEILQVFHQRFYIIISYICKFTIDKPINHSILFFIINITLFFRAVLGVVNLTVFPGFLTLIVKLALK